MSCFSCGVSFGAELNVVLRQYKDYYLKTGIITYYYKTSANGDVKICQKESFDFIYENEIKPNLDKGAEYACISEY